MRTIPLIFGLLAALWGAEGPRKEPAGEIGGFVRSAKTGEPLKSVQVSLRLPRASETGTLNTTTGPSGTFLFTGLPAGIYRLVIEKAGYLTLIDSDSRVQLGEGQRETSLDFALIPAAAVSGMTSDASGEGVAGAEIRAYQIVYRRGVPHLVERGRAETDDLGEYRIYNLRAGRYILRAAPPRDGATGSFYADTPAAYYPNASGPAQALPVTVNWGDEVSGVDLEFTEGPTYLITGAAFEAGTGGPCGLCSVRATRLDGIYSVLLPDSASVAPDGLFVIRGLNPGTYQVIARRKGGGDLVAQQEIRVDASNIDDVAILHVGKGQTLSGKIIVEDPPEGVSAAGMAVDLESAVAPWAWPRRDAFVNGDLTFRIENLPGATYRFGLDPLPEGAYLQTLRVHGQEMPEPKIQVPEGMALSGVEAVVAFDGAVVAGKVKLPGSANGAPVDIEAKVVLVPKPGQSGFIKSRFVLTAADGSYSLAGVAPGEYMLYAVPAGVTSELTDPMLQPALERYGREVRLQPKDMVSIDPVLAPREAAQW